MAKRIGRYEIRRELGRGAMGIVYLAHDPRLDRRVALKTYVLPEGIPEARARELRERFLREARAAAALDHPSIVTVYDSGEEPAGGTPYMAMEYVEGDTLAGLIAREGRISPERAMRMAEALADALAAAHRAGIVHRDLKPANILVRARDGVVKIADFGIARVPSSDLTTSGSMLGSPAYMSPEQVRGGAVDARSDLFSLAVIFYEMLTGQRPFQGEDAARLVYAIAHETPLPPTRLVEGLPAGLDGFFDRALAKDPARRFPDARAFRQALGHAWRTSRPAGEATQVERRSDPPDTPGDPPAPVVPGAATRRPRRVVAAAALVLLVATVWAFVVHRPARLHLEGRNSVEEGTLVVLVDDTEVYRRDLAAAPVNKAVGFLRKVAGRAEEKFEAWLDVEPGPHEITAELHTPGRPVQRETIVARIEPGRAHSLKITTGLAFRRPVAVQFEEDWE